MPIDVIPQVVRDLATSSHPPGARFVACALQVNPYAYLKGAKRSRWPDEKAYNQAIVDALTARGVEVIAITDHNRVSESVRLAEAAGASGITVFPGFEVPCNAGVHVLALFEPGTSWERLGSLVGLCGAVAGEEVHTQGAHAFRDLVACIQDPARCGGLAIAAHATGDKGLLRTLVGQARRAAWTDPALLAVAIHTEPEAVDDQAIRDILTGRDANYRREHPPALLFARDVSQPEDLDDPRAITWLKLSSRSLLGLREAFLAAEHGGRVRRSVPEANAQPHLRGVVWQGGFLDGQVLPLNPDLNAIIGGRGTGKSAVVRSLEFALGEPEGASESAALDAYVRGVLGAGARVWVALAASAAGGHARSFVVCREVSAGRSGLAGRAEVFELTSDGVEPVALPPARLVPGMQFFGQGRIAELARDTVAQTALLRPLRRDDADALDAEIAKDREGLAENRRKLESARSRLQALRADLDDVPDLELKLAGFRAVGGDRHVAELERKKRGDVVVATARERVDAVEAALESLREAEIDTAFLEDAALAETGATDLLRPLRDHLSGLRHELVAVVERANAALTTARVAIDAVGAGWSAVGAAIDQAYADEVVRSLGEDAARQIDSVRRRLANLEPKQRAADGLEAEIGRLESERADLVRSLEASLATEQEQVDRAGKILRTDTDGRLRARANGRDLAALEAELLQIPNTGRGTLDGLRSRLGEVGPIGLARMARRGADALQAAPLSLTPALAASWAADPGRLERIEEVVCPLSVEVELRVEHETASGDRPGRYEPLHRLSVGQKATALLLLALRVEPKRAETRAPLVLDQPEDDLDNRFIVAEVVALLGKVKAQRQLVLVTHNANIPVLGDAELVVPMQARVGDDGEVHGVVERALLGAIDHGPTQEQMKLILEGGRAAFELRRLRYGF